jgi:hypothetical protein
MHRPFGGVDGREEVREMVVDDDGVREGVESALRRGEVMGCIGSAGRVRG